MVSENEVDRTGERIEPHGVLSGVGPPITTTLRAAKAVARDEGVSDVTIWRRVKAGLLTTVNISGRPYITNESLAAFYRRAAAGEFAKPPAGAARRSAESRAGKGG
jgi:hypothetical protein